MSDIFRNKKVLITGGTGSFGKAFTGYLLKKCKPEVVRIFSRDELKQHEMNKEFGDNRLRFLIGDIRDKDRLTRAMTGIDIVVHAAALKQVPLCEYNPFEAIKTNVLGGQNIIDVAIDKKVPKVLALSTDKAVNPVNLYGASKLCAEKLFVDGNAYAGADKTRFSCVRYGNVLGSRGSVVSIFNEQKKKGELTITDSRMTRFWITLDQAVEFVSDCIGLMNGGEIFVPKIPSMKIIDLAKAILPDGKIKTVGIRPGEKLHEVLLTEEEARNTLEFDKFYIIEPDFEWWEASKWKKGKKAKDNFRYASDTNTEWLTIDSMKNLLKEF